MDPYNCPFIMIFGKAFPVVYSSIPTKLGLAGAGAKVCGYDDSSQEH